MTRKYEIVSHEALKRFIYRAEDAVRVAVIDKKYGKAVWQEFYNALCALNDTREMD